MARNLCSLRCSIVGSAHHWRVDSVLGSLAVTAAIMWSSQVCEAFGLGVPSVEEIEVVVLIAVTITLLSEGVKMVLRRMEASSQKVTAAVQWR